jgi:hypothetical protein
VRYEVDAAFVEDAFGCIIEIKALAIEVSATLVMSSKFDEAAACKLCKLGFDARCCAHALFISLLYSSIRGSSS